MRILLLLDHNYVLKLWLACGITTVRDVGSPLSRALSVLAEATQAK